MPKSPTRRYLRHREKGTIYNYSELAMKDNAINLEEITEKEAFPAKFAPKSAKGRKSKVDLATEVIPEPPSNNPGLDAEASRGLSE